MPSVPGSGMLSYNGVSFDTAKINLRFRCEPERDEADRTVVFMKYTLDFDVVVSDGSDTGVNVLAFRRMISSDGGPLIVSGLGFGDFRVNDGVSGVFDGKWGPKCRAGAWNPIGAMRACMLPVTIETWIPECDSAIYQHGIAAFNYEVEWRIVDGLSTQTISGYLEIPITRWGGQASRNVPDSADEYREQIVFPSPTGFRRRPQSFTLSKDRRRLNFAMVDEEMDSDNAPPKGAVEIEGRHVARNRDTYATEGIYLGSFRVHARGARGVPRSDILAAAIKVIKDRLGEIANAGIVGDVKAVTSLVIRGLSVEEDIWGRDFAFGLDYQFAAKLDTFLKASGFWRPADGCDWETWATSMEPSWKVRGHAGLAYNAENDVIVDLCSNEASMYSPGAPEPKMEARPNPLFGLPKPNKADSWLEYQCSLVAQRRESNLTHKVYQDLPPTMISNPKGWLDIENDSPASMGPQQGTNDIIQHLSTPSYRVWLIGKAARIGYHIPKPELTEVGSIKNPEKETDIFIPTLLKTSPSGPIFGAAWRQSYILPNSPIEPPHAPAFDERQKGKGGI